MTGEWVPAACTLPTAERPLRVAEFDEVFARSVSGADRADDRTLVLDLDPAAAARVADLAVRETGCCSFFTFTLTATGGSVRLTIGVPPDRVDVLDALASRAGAA